jgi:Tfp pilus assembly protein PilV
MQRRRVEAGFTMVEVMVAVLLTAIAVIGIVGLYRVQTRSADYSRRSTEASVLASDKMEALRTTDAPCAPACNGTEANINATGTGTPAGPYTRTWDVTQPSPTQWKLQVTVSWDDDGTTRSITIFSLRPV